LHDTECPGGPSGRRDPPEALGETATTTSVRNRLQILLVGQAGFAEMNLRVHDARQDVQSLAVDDLGGVGLPQRPDRGDPPLADRDVPDALAVLIDLGAGRENGVESPGHLSPKARGNGREMARGPCERPSGVLTSVAAS
jgi:hypothetical protein